MKGAAEVMVQPTSARWRLEDVPEPINLINACSSLLELNSPAPEWPCQKAASSGVDASPT